MDVIDRRMMIGRLLAQMASGSIKHQQVKVTTSDSMYLTFSHSLEVKPKFIIVSTSDDYTRQNGKIYHIACDDTVGGVIYVNSNGATTYNGYMYGQTNANSRYTFDDTSVTMRQVTVAITFDTNVEYIADIYA